MIEQAVILAGGKGTRLMPLTQNTPKPLVPVAGKPFLVWQLLHLKNQGIKRVLLLVSHFADQIIRYFTEHPIPGLTISFSSEPEPLGTGGAVVNAIDQLEDEFFVLNGDSFAPMQYRAMEKAFVGAKASICMAVIAAEKTPEVLGNVKLHRAAFQEYRKDGGMAAGFNYVDAGVYIYQKIVLRGLNAGAYGIEKTWESPIKNQALMAHKIEERFFDIGTPERLKFFEGQIANFFKMESE